MEAPPLERRLVAILAADVEGYSRLMHGDEEATMATLSACRALADELIAQHRGRIANTAGDSVLAEFASVLDARGRDPSGASKGQRRRAARTPDALPDRRQCRRRHGQGRRHFRRRRERSCSARGAGQGGEICVSRGVHDHLRHRGGMVFDDLGEQLVKNIAHPIRAFRLRTADATSQQEIPTPETPEPSSALATSSELSADNEVALELALWESVKDGSPAELESYLEQYPGGTFASLARTRLDAAALSPATPATSTPEDAAAEALDLAFWNSVKDSDRREELQAYLEQHPNGHFAGLARARLSSADVT